MPEVIEIEFHSKELSDFRMRRLVRANLRKFSVPITAFISDATIAEDTCLGVSFDHIELDDVYRPADCAILRTGKIQRTWKEGSSGYLKRERAITSSAASCAMPGGEVFLRCFAQANASESPDALTFKAERTQPCSKRTTQAVMTAT